MNDTSPEAEAIALDVIRRMDPVDRMLQALNHSEAMRELALNRLREVHPEKTTLELVEILLGEVLIPDEAARPR